MKISERIFKKIILLCIGTILIAFSCVFFQLFTMRNNLVKKLQTDGEKFHSSAVELLKKNGNENASEIVSNYTAIIDNKLNTIAEDLFVLKTYLEDLYLKSKPHVSKYDNNQVFLMKDVDMNDVKQEFDFIKSIRDLIDNMSPDINTSNIIYVSDSGMLLSPKDVDRSSTASIDRRTRDWYVGAVKKGKINWTACYNDINTGEKMVTCSVPIYKSDGTVGGVASKDITINDICSSVMKTNSEFIDYSFLTDNTGDFIVGSREGMILSDVLNEEVKDKLLNEMQNNEGGFISDDNIMAGFSSVKATGWKICVILNYEKILKPAQYIGESIKSTNVLIQEEIESKIQMTNIIVVILLSIIILLVFYITKKITDSIVNPIKLLNEGASIIGKGNLDHKIEINTNDELDDLGKSFNKMGLDLKKYMDDFVNVAADKERIKAELNVATVIQESMLPCVFPAFPNRPDFDIYAAMQPAKEVGGDFYDFFIINDSTLVFVIADVSGKGVPAALFMVIAKTLIKDHAIAGKTPSQVLEVVNNRLCESNGAEMFLTAFMGMIDLRTGKLTYANAGHNPPLIYRKNKEFEWMSTKPGFVLAGFSNMKYKDEEIVLDKGDKIYLYTDGVTEALNVNAELYSANRLKIALNNATGSEETPKEILINIAKSISDFVGEAEQSDDITMMLLEIKDRKI
ncbi:MAG: SpoIIE family protein phosphatase [Oscillospiraceae bacterium]|nr:SpoIIE family protein phosphatase [Oscillospiraceae bacterium]